MCLLVAGGCTDEPAPRAAKRDCRWAIGTMGAFSGDGSEQMIRLFRAVELAVDTAREQGDLACDVELESEDTSGDPDRARSRARALVDNDRLVACVCPFRSDETIQAGTVFDAAGVAMISAGTSDAIVEQGFETWFRTLPRDQIQADATVRYVSEGLRPGRVAVVHDGTGAGVALADAVASGLGEAVVRRADTAASSSDQVAAGLAQDDVQLVYFAGEGSDAAAVTRALREADVPAQVLIGAPEPGALPGTSELEGLDAVLVACPCAAPSVFGDAGEFAEAYTQVNDEMPGPFTAELYDVTRLVLDVLKGATAQTPIEEARADVLLGLRARADRPAAAGRFAWDDAGELVVEPLRAVWIYEYNPRQGVLAPMGPVDALI